MFHLFQPFTEALNMDNCEFESEPGQSAHPLSFHSTAAWTSEEDKDLWSTVMVKGNNQSGETFCANVMNAFNKKHVEKTRFTSGITDRFGKINLQTQFYESRIYKIKQANPSGMRGEAEQVCSL